MELQHSIRIPAPVQAVWAVIADAEQWPTVFPPTIHSIASTSDDGRQQLKIWAMANGEPKSWESHRELDEAAGTITFQQTKSAPPIKMMKGTWRLTEDDGATIVVLHHEWESLDGSAESEDWIYKAVDGNSVAELQKLSDAVVAAQSFADRQLTFEDTVEIDAPGDVCFQLLDRGEEWIDLLPHVAAADFQRLDNGLQYLKMTTRAKDGSEHDTASYRVSLGNQIAYKQFTLPPLLELHSGLWTVAERDGGCTVTSEHTIRVREENIAKYLGDEADVETAKQYLRDALGTNSRATMNIIKQRVESK